MGDVEIADEDGATLKLRDVGGRYFLNFFPAEHWRSIKELKIRDSDVLLCSYPKSGFHWVWEITMMLKNGNASPLQNLMDTHIVDFTKPQDFDKFITPRTLTTHRYLSELPDDVQRKQIKLVYLLRDPKDVCVSYYNHIMKLRNVVYNGKFPAFVKLFLKGKVLFNDWIQHILKWSSELQTCPDQPLLVIHYEDMKRFPNREIKRLADFLEVEASEELVSDIIANTSFATMKKNKEKLPNINRRAFKGNKEIMYRKGEIGDWKNWFEDGLDEYFDIYISSRLRGRNLGRLESVKRYMIPLNSSKL